MQSQFFEQAIFRSQDEQLFEEQEENLHQELRHLYNLGVIQGQQQTRSQLNQLDLLKLINILEQELEVIGIKKLGYLIQALSNLTQKNLSILNLDIQDFLESLVNLGKQRQERKQGERSGQKKQRQKRVKDLEEEDDEDLDQERRQLRRNNRKKDADEISQQSIENPRHMVGPQDIDLQQLTPQRDDLDFGGENSLGIREDSDQKFIQRLMESSNKDMKKIKGLGGLSDNSSQNNNLMNMQQEDFQPIMEYDQEENEEAFDYEEYLKNKGEDLEEFLNEVQNSGKKKNKKNQGNKNKKQNQMMQVEEILEIRNVNENNQYPQEIVLPENFQTVVQNNLQENEYNDILNEIKNNEFIENIALKFQNDNFTSNEQNQNENFNYQMQYETNYETYEQQIETNERNEFSENNASTTIQILQQENNKINNKTLIQMDKTHNQIINNLKNSNLQQKEIQIVHAEINYPKSKAQFFYETLTLCKLGQFKLVQNSSDSFQPIYISL